MILAFSFWEALWLLFISFLFISVLMMLFSVIIDLFRDKELSGWGKAGWVIVLVMFPLFGLLIYVIARGQGMAERAVKDQADSKESFDNYIREVSTGAASELEKAATLHSSGRLTDEEYSALKSKIIG